MRSRLTSRRVVAMPSGAARTDRAALSRKGSGPSIPVGADVAFALEGVGTRSGPSPIPPVRGSGPRASTGTRLAWLLAGLGFLSAAILGVLYARRSGGEGRAVRFEVAAPANGAFQGIIGVSSSVISPDGQTLAMAVTTESGPRCSSVRSVNGCQTTRGIRRVESVLVTDQPLARVLRGRKDEARGAERRRPADDLRRAGRALADRDMGTRQHDPVHQVPGLRSPVPCSGRGGEPVRR